MINSTTSTQNEIYELLMAHLTREIDQKTFKIEKMPEYIQQAKEYAGIDSNLLERIIIVLNSTEFQTSQIEYLDEWDKKLIISQECGFPKEVFYTSRKIDKAFDFFKKNFCWGVC